MKVRRQKAEKPPSPKKKLPKALPSPHKPILLRNPTNIGHKAEQYRSRHEAIELGGQSNIAHLRKNLCLPQPTQKNCPPLPISRERRTVKEKEGRRKREGSIKEQCAPAP